MLKKRTYIVGVVSLMSLLLLTRIIDFMRIGLDFRTIVFTLIELVFWVWGIILLKKDSSSSAKNK